MERNMGTLLLAVALIVIFSLFSGKLTGQASKEERGTKSCFDTDLGNNIYGPGAVITFVNGRQAYYPDRCGGTLSVIENYCDDGKRRFKESFCVDGMECKMSASYQGGNRYGPAAYCG